MSSYDIGMIYGYMQAQRWLKKSLPQPNITDTTHSGIVAYQQHHNMFDGMVKEDFIYGYCDAIEAAYKHERIPLMAYA